MITYRNYVPVAYPPSDKGMPVPGWDMRNRLAGGRIIAIGASPDGLGGLGYDMVISTPLGKQTISIPIEQAMQAGIASAMPQLKSQMSQVFVGEIWPQIQPKLRAELETSVQAAKDEMRRNMLIGGAVVVATIIGAAMWTKKR